MKKSICFFLLIVLLLSFAGCKKNKSTETVQNLPAPQGNPLTSTYDPNQEYEFDELITPDPQLTAKGCPNLSKNLQELYAGAAEMVRAFNQCNFSAVVPGLTREISGMNYLVVNDSRFPTYNDLVTYLQTIFTDEFIYGNLLTANSCVKSSSDGLVCVLDAGVGDDITYAGHVFTVTEQTPTKVQLSATVYFALDVYDGEKFYTTPSNPDSFTTTTLQFTIVNTDKGWRFSQCPFIG